MFRCLYKQPSMKKRIHTLLLALCLFSLGAAWAEPAPLPVNVKEHTRKATGKLKQLPRVTREAALAEISGLLFMHDGRKAYSSKTSSERIPIMHKGKVTGETRIPNRSVFKGAVFVGSDGKVYDFYAALPDTDAQRQAWKQAKLHIYHAGKDVILKRFEDERRELEIQRAIYFLRQMEPELRQALFAEMMGLLYLEGGTEAYTGEVLYSTIDGERVPYQGYRKGARFRDSMGSSRSIEQVRSEASKRGKAWRTWWPGVKLHIHHVGHKEIFAAFKDEIQAMRKHAGK